MIITTTTIKSVSIKLIFHNQNITMTITTIATKTTKT